VNLDFSNLGYSIQNIQAYLIQEILTKLLPESYFWQSNKKISSPLNKTLNIRRLHMFAQIKIFISPILIKHKACRIIWVFDVCLIPLHAALELTDAISDVRSCFATPSISGLPDNE